MIANFKILFLTILSNIVSKLNGKYVTAILTETNKGTFLVSASDSTVGRKLRYTGSYGKDELRVIEQYLTKSDRLLVIGAHVGTLAIPLSKKIREVYAIEPNPISFKLLSANIHLNDCKNITPIQVAASNKTETLKFLANTVNSGGSKREPINRAWKYYFDSPNELEVDAKKMDDILTRKVDFVVIDCEGSEYFALSGMEEILKKAKGLYIEFIPHHIKDVSNVDINTFLSLIFENFAVFVCPVTGAKLAKKEAFSFLQNAYANNQSYDGLVFLKTGAK